MIHDPSAFDRVLILADDSANWRVAGLRQLERLALALNEFAASANRRDRLDVSICWKPGIKPSDRWLPEQSRIPFLRVTESQISIESGARILSTHLFVERNAMAMFLEMTPVATPELSSIDPAEAWHRLFEQFEQACRAGGEDGWRFLEDSNEISGSERRFLRRAGKSQDGFVSKFLNRPISQRVTRLLLKFPITPTAWTLSIFMLPIICFAFLLRGDYISILIGTVIYQIYSILDGCDGEVARAKYLESKAGGRIDDFCDIVGGLLFVIGLGFGLYYSSAAPNAWLYGAEGILCATLIATNEFLLRSTKQEPNLKSRELGAAMYPRHRQLVEHSGLAFFGEHFAWWLVQITKRDVGILFFVLLALAGLSQWILHLWITVTVVGFSLSIIARFRSRL